MKKKKQKNPKRISTAVRMKMKFQKFKQQNIIQMSELLEGKRLSEKADDSIKTFEELISQGYDPVHAIYVNTQNLLSFFAEQISTFPELKAYYKLAEKAEDEYMPGFPPMSPITSSFFTLWAFSDLRFGKSKETITGCFLDLIPSIGVGELHRKTVTEINKSRMGIYKHQGIKNKKIIFKELLTQQEYQCICPAGYSGKKGELWFVRLLPDPMNVTDYHIVMTTPYLLMGQLENEWEAFFKRSSISPANVGYEARLHKFMKHGPSAYFWLEFIFQSYVNHRPDAIFLTGIPDIKTTLPHAPESGMQMGMPMQFSSSEYKEVSSNGGKLAG